MPVRRDREEWRDRIIGRATQRQKYLHSVHDNWSIDPTKRGIVSTN